MRSLNGNYQAKNLSLSLELFCSLVGGFAMINGGECPLFVINAKRDLRVTSVIFAIGKNSPTMKVVVLPLGINACGERSGKV